MEVNFTREETIKLIEEYYRRLESREVKAGVTTNIGYVGIYEDEECQTTFTITEKMEIVGMEKDVDIKLSHEDVERNLGALFATYDLQLTGMIVNDGLDYEDRSSIRSAYFRGLTLNVEKLKQKAKKNYKKRSDKR